MKKHKKDKTLWLKVSDVEVGYLYFTTANQYRAVLAMQGDFLIYAPSSEGLEADFIDMPFENSPCKKCQILTFAQKEYQAFTLNGVQAIRHPLTEAQLAEAVVQCNATSAIAELGG